jgi:hypothetical protein
VERAETGIFQALANLSVLNCGLCRERGIVRTSTRRRISCARKQSMNSPIGLVEWPTVQIVGCLACMFRDGSSPFDLLRVPSPVEGRDRAVAL